MKLAAAPISWGVCEVPGWGAQLPLDRVLADAARLGLTDVEAGPPGFLPPQAAQARAAVARHGVHVIGAFVTAVLHQPEVLDAELRSVAAQAAHLADLGGAVLVLAAASGNDGYEAPLVLDREEWLALLAALPKVVAIATTHRLRVALHPHVGTAIERADAIERLLDHSDIPLCLDTGHVFIGGADPADLARRHAERITHVHLKDADAHLADAVRARRIGYADAVARGLYKPLGTGDAHIADVLGALHRAGYAGWAVLEQDIALRKENAARDPAEDVARCRDFAMAHA
ncbi:MAG TPA: TIM barrel protein [Candidatus Limnocylindria bacterium]